MSDVFSYKDELINAETDPRCLNMHELEMQCIAWRWAGLENHPSVEKLFWLVRSWQAEPNHSKIKHAFMANTDGQWCFIEG